MDEFKQLMVIPWELGKYYFTNLPETIDDYNKFTEKANELLKTQKVGTKEYTLVKRMLSAVNDYCDEHWRITHQGEQMSLWNS